MKQAFGLNEMNQVLGLNDMNQAFGLSEVRPSPQTIARSGHGRMIHRGVRRMRYTQSDRAFPLAPSEGERAGVRGRLVWSILPHKTSGFK